MTNKIYKSAQGKMVDLGTIILKNEHVRAVGNMKVNARGDKLDSLNHVVETRTERIQRHNDRTSVSSIVPQSSNKQAKPVKAKNKNKKIVDPTNKINSNQTEPAAVDIPNPVQAAKPVESVPPVQNRPVATPAPQPAKSPVAQNRPKAPELNLDNPTRPAKSPAAGAVASTGQGGGLAGAIARSREIKQELDRSRRQQAQDNGLRKI